MLSLTAKFCCSRLPPRISMLTTDTLGRLNLGATREHPARHSRQATAFKPRAAVAAVIALFKMRSYALILSPREKRWPSGRRGIATRVFAKVLWDDFLVYCMDV